MGYLESIITHTDEMKLNLFVFLFALIEYLLPVVPGDLALAFGVFMGVYGGYSISLIFCSSIIGGTAGAIMVLLIGRYINSRFDQSRLADLLQRYYADSKEKIDRAIELIKKYGFLIILVNRFIPVLRGPIVFAAGYSRVNFVKAVLSVFLSAFLFNMAITIVSVAVGRNFEMLKSFISYYFEGAILLVILIVLLYKFKCCFVRRRE